MIYMAGHQEDQVPASRPSLLLLAQGSSYPAYQYSPFYPATDHFLPESIGQGERMWTVWM
jgi:hypothetical protein